MRPRHPRPPQQEEESPKETLPATANLHPSAREEGQPQTHAARAFHRKLGTPDPNSLMCQHLPQALDRWFRTSDTEAVRSSLSPNVRGHARARKIVDRSAALLARRGG